MNKKEILINGLRYYKGESANPFSNGDKALFWDYEKKWVEMFLEDSEILYSYWGEYDNYGMRNFEPNDGVPVTLKALLFNRYCHWMGSVPFGGGDFRTWYKERYIGQV